MKGICQSCGREDFLHSCPVCGAMICNKCLLEYGCKICKGKLRME